MKLLAMLALFVLFVALPTDATQVNSTGASTETSKVHSDGNAPDNDLGKDGVGARLDAALEKLQQLESFNNENKKMSKRMNKMNKKINTVKNEYKLQNDIVERLSNETSKQGKALAVHDTELSEIEGVVENQSDTDEEMKRNLTDTQEDLADQDGRIVRLDNETIAQQEEISLQDEEITRLQNVIDKQGKDIMNQAEIIREQKEEVSSLHQKMSQIELTLTNYAPEISKIVQNERRSSNNANQISKIAPEMTQLKATQDNQNSVNARQDGQINKLNIRVYFSAYSTQNGITVRKGQTLVLGKVHTNIGKNYNPSTGIFTCVTPGTYEFMIKASTSNDLGYSVHLGIYKNNNVQASLRSKKVKDYFTDASTSVILSLKKNDKVQVKGEWVTSRIHAMGGGKPYAIFSGKLLSAD